MANLFIDTRGRTKRLQKAPIDPEMVSGTKIGTGERPAHFIYSPMLFRSAALIARPGLRYYVHSFFVSMSNEVLDDNTYARLALTVNGNLDYLYIQINPLQVNSVSQQIILDVLTDENRGVTVSFATANYLRADFAFTYQEVFVDV